MQSLLSHSRRCALLAVVLCAHVLGAYASRRHDLAWVRRYRCAEGSISVQQFPRGLRVPPPNPPFFISDFRGEWRGAGDSAELLLDIMVVHNADLLSCEDINITSLEDSLDFETLGQSVGKVTNFSSNCPLPITNDLTPLNSDRFSTYQITYHFDASYRLQTMVSTFNFTHTNGSALDCGVGKITPDIGRRASLAFTLTPIFVLAFVALAAARVHLTDAGFRAFLDRSSVLERQGPVWAMILDITTYFRYLQFIFLSASLSIEYPGFFVPVVGELKWAALLFWRGPFSYHYSTPGIDGGMYVSNATYGPDFMNQMLGYSNMLDTVANSTINLLILVSTIFLALLTLFLLRIGLSHSAHLSLSAAAKKSGGITLGLGLCFFSVPLLSYFAYDLILVGFLPNFRIALAIIVLLIIVSVNYFFIHHVNEQIYESLISGNDIEGRQRKYPVLARKTLESVFRHLPHSFPLVQAACVGGFQDYPPGQLIALAGCEVIVLIHNALTPEERFFTSTTTYTSLIRFVTAMLNVVFYSAALEATRQWTGYLILALHGCVGLPGFVAKACWQLYRTFYPGRLVFEVGHSGETPRPSRSVDSFNMGTLPSRSSSQVLGYRKGHMNESLSHEHVQDPSYFYRAPRSRSTTPMDLAPLDTRHMESSSLPSSSMGVIDEERQVESLCSEETHFDMDSALSHVPHMEMVDYSIREVDLYYGIQPNASGSALILSPGPTTSTASDTETLADSPSSRKGKFRIPLDIFRFRRKQREKGFEVIRPKGPEKGFEVTRPPRPPL